MDLVGRLEALAGSPIPDVPALAIAISGIPYGRNLEQSADAVVREGRGTCSTKHLLLRDAIREVWSQSKVELWHRPYRVTRDLAEELWGPEVAHTVPEIGLDDVHTYAKVHVGERWADVDVTVPVAQWDGLTDMPLQCGPGTDIPGGEEPLATKRSLVLEHCDPSAREPFIAALTRHLEASARSPWKAR